MESWQVAAAVVFWLSLGVVVYVYALYPPLVWLLSRLAGRAAPPPELPDEALPGVSLLIAAYNEEAVIAARLESALAMDYPADRLEIVVGSDGSSDRTAELVGQYAERGVRLLDYRQRRGKATVLNDSVGQCRGEVVIFSDANTDIAADAPRRLVRWLADRRVAAVCGKLELTDPHTGRNVDSVYWRYETFLKTCEGRLGALLGANGAIYALRRAEFEPIPGDTIIDDFVIPLLVKLRTGGRIAYEPGAVAFEETPETIQSEFVRRARIGAGGFQTIARLWRLLSPRHGWTAFSFLSHKVLRWLCPFFLVAALVSNLALAGMPLYRGLLALHVAFYVVSLIGAYVPGRGLAVRLVRLTTMFTSMNAALLLGFWRWISRRQRGVWQRTAR